MMIYIYDDMMQLFFDTKHVEVVPFNKIYPFNPL